MSVLIQIPARAGSKGVPGKNLKRVGTLSLIAHAVRVARDFLARSGLTGRILVDTDGAELAAEADACGVSVPFLRPPQLAADHSPTIDTTLHVLERLEAAGEKHDDLVLLQPTSPLRTVDDVEASWRARGTSESTLTVTVPEHPVHRAFTQSPDGALHSLLGPESLSLPRQQLPRVLQPNGAVYVASARFLRARRAFFAEGVTIGVEMPRERSVDVDTLEDFARCEALLDVRPEHPFPFLPQTLGHVTSDEHGLLLPGQMRFVRTGEPPHVAGRLLERWAWQDATELHRAVASGLPLILEVGSGSAFPLALALDQLRRADPGRAIALLDSTGVAVTVLALRRTFGLPVGASVSDLASGAEVVAAGARFIVRPAGSDPMPMLDQLHLAVRRMREG